MTTFPELRELEKLLELGREHLQSEAVCTVQAGNNRYPVYKIVLGNPDPKLPAVGFFGGIHGLERIGSHVLLAFLRSLLSRLQWDKSLHHLLEHMQLVFMPLINPGGMANSTRCNPNGVDLMRNSPVEAGETVPFLLAGQRFSRHLPWYRGAADQAMEIENQALCQVVQQHLLSRRFSIALDCHSGFGLRDRIWFPHAHTCHPIAHLAEIWALSELFQQTYPHHRYLIEPQSLRYLTHGDIWDCLYLQTPPEHVFLPLTLEMGSWLWVKKNPRQLFSRLGIFNPVAAHRLQRVLRSHLVWLNFLLSAAVGHQAWQAQGPRRCRLQELAVLRWYRP
jgi:hypothetical protein